MPPSSQKGQRQGEVRPADAQGNAPQHPGQKQAAHAAQPQLCGREVPEQEGHQGTGQCGGQNAQREPAQQGHHPHQAQHGRKGRAADDAVHAIGNAGALGQCDQQSFPQQRGGNAQIDIAHARQGDPGCKAAFGSQQHQHHGTGSGFQPKAGVPPQAQHRTAADAGQILQQAHAAKEQSSQQRCEQPDREQALGPQQLRLSHTGGCPAHAHSSQHPHHQAEPAHGGGLRRALRLGIRRFLLG